MTEKYDFKFDSVNKNKWIEDETGNTVMIEGVGKDAEIVTNEKGGKQSKAPMAMHLISHLGEIWHLALWGYGF